MNILRTVLSYAYMLACVFLPCIVYQAIQYRKWDHQGKLSKTNLAWRFVFILYLCLVMRAVGMSSIWDIGKDGPVIQWDTINLIPFQSIGERTQILNIILFMPLGFLMPLIWQKSRAFWGTVLAGFLFSLSIEIGQLFNHRTTDIDDLFMNVLGTVVGFGVWFLFDKIFKTKPREAGIFPDAAPHYLVLTVVSSFLLCTWRIFRIFR